MTNHPNRSRKYRDVEIVSSNATSLNNGKPLLELRGAIEKAASRRPLITSVADARRYIDAALDAGISF